MTEHHDENSYLTAFSSQESLGIFLRNMRKFDQRFCELMTSGLEFVINLEVRGNQGEMLHCCVRESGWDRPPGVDRKIYEKSKHSR